jgi:hypothetical protein
MILSLVLLQCGVVVASEDLSSAGPFHCLLSLVVPFTIQLSRTLNMEKKNPHLQFCARDQKRINLCENCEVPYN